MLFDVPHQVIALNGDDDVILKNIKGDTVLASVSDTQPIHITASLLKQMGWLGDSSYLYLYLEEGISFQYYMYEKRLSLVWKGVDEWSNHATVTETIFKCTARFLHDLQNAVDMARHGVDLNVEKLFK
jgi:hypothetical protein